MTTQQEAGTARGRGTRRAVFALVLVSGGAVLTGGPAAADQEVSRTIVASVYTRGPEGISLVATGVPLHAVAPSKLLEPGTSWRVQVEDDG